MQRSEAEKIHGAAVAVRRDFLEYADSLLDTDAPDPRALQRRSAIAAKRRAQFTIYVSAAIALAVMVCGAAVVKVAASRGHESSPRSGATAR